MPRVDTAALWTRFHGELHRFVRARVDSDETAEDLLQSAFLAAHRRIVAGDVPTHPRAWLHQIVRNLIIDARRRSRRERALADAVEAEPTHDAHARHDDADDIDAFTAVARALPLFIDALEPTYRDALRMTELEGLTQAEAATRAGVSHSGMKTRVQRGRKQVYEALQRCCEFELDARRRVTDCAPRTDSASCC